MIEFSHVSKTYRKVTALDDVSFTVSSGSVTGFLGPNGAGKTTALRILVGLTRATAGSATVLGRPYRELACPGAQVGTLLDAAAVHPGRTGREVLTLGATVLGLPGSRVGHALLARPRVLVLDEPANGLDPQGIRWMRRLLRSLADGGCAVLLSSHLLHEVERIADPSRADRSGPGAGQGHGRRPRPGP